METKTDIMADARGFMKSRVILTAAELDVFTQLDGNFLTVVELIKVTTSANVYSSKTENG